MMNATTVEQVQANAAVDSRSDATAMKVYRYIVSYKTAHDGCAPSFRQIAKRTGVSSTSMVGFYIEKLETLRLVRRASDDEGISHNNSIEVVGATWMPPGERV